MPRRDIVDMIISEARKGYGRGQVFYRTDGLAFEERRAAKRAAYLRDHPETSPEHRELIERGGLTPGMSHGESIAAWGLIEEDLAKVSGRTTADANYTAYSCYRGFEVGRRYTLYLSGDEVLGIREEE